MMLSLIWYFLFSFFMINILWLSSHPLMFSGILIFFTILLSSLSTYLNISWFSIMLILIFLGGVMILLLYMNSLSANEKINWQKLSNLSLSFIFTFFWFFEFSSKYPTFSSSKMFIIQLYSSSNMVFSIFLMIYLLVTLVSVVKLVKSEKGPFTSRL